MSENGIGCETDGHAKIFTRDGRSLMVHEIIDHWHEAQEEYTRLLADDERIYLLRRVKGNTWEVRRFYAY